MLDRAWGGGFAWGRGGRDAKGSHLKASRPSVEAIEGRMLMAASIAAIAPVTVPQSLGFQVPVNGSDAGAPQTFTVRSDNPDIKAAVAAGRFLTMNVSHTPAAGQATDPTISNAPLTYQLFEDLTPMTTGKIASFVQSGFYNGKTITRIASNFSNKGTPADVVIQGGAPNPDGTGSSGLPGTPFGTEIVQQLAYTGPGALAMARSSSTNSNDTQFFFTTGPQPALNQLYTIFGQVLNDPATQATVSQLTQVATAANPNLGNEKSSPISPVTINAAALSSTNPNGVIHIDATGAVAGETANVQVTAFDATTNTTAVQTFKVTVGPDTTNHDASYTFKPLAFPITQQVISGQGNTVQLNGTTQNPNNKAVTVQYSVATQPAHGTISTLNTTTGTLTYTPAVGYIGADSFTYRVTNVGGTPTPLAGNTQTVNLNVAPSNTQPVNTGTVRVVGTVLLVTPAPRTDRGTNNIVVTQTSLPNSPANERLVVSVNGVFDTLQPLASSIDRIVVYGSKAGDNVTITNAVSSTISATLDGGQAGKNVLRAGAGSTREHGWFGSNNLYGGTGPNQLVGSQGHVKFHPTATTNEIFVARPRQHFKDNIKPGGTFYKSVNGKIVPAASATRKTVTVVPGTALSTNSQSDRLTSK